MIEIHHVYCEFQPFKEKEFPESRVQNLVVVVIVVVIPLCVYLLHFHSALIVPKLCTFCPL